MALKPCVQCGKDISAEAATCPHCGKITPTEPRLSPLVKMIITLIVLAVILVLTLILRPLLGLDFGR